jgi:hypothetical protein
MSTTINYQISTKLLLNMPNSRHLDDDDGECWHFISICLWFFDSVVTSRVVDSDSSRLELLFSTTRLESNTKNDSSQQPQMTRLADFAVNDSSQLSYNLYRINSSTLLWLYCMGRTMSPVNNENFETLSENIWDLHRIYFWRACLYYISVFRNNASATVFKMENFLYLY